MAIFLRLRSAMIHFHSNPLRMVCAIAGNYPNPLPSFRRCSVIDCFPVLLLQLLFARCRIVVSVRCKADATLRIIAYTMTASRAAGSGRLCLLLLHELMPSAFSRIQARARSATDKSRKPIYTDVRLPHLIISDFLRAHKEPS